MNSRKHHLMSWVTGHAYGLDLPAAGAASVVLEDAADLGALLAGGLAGSASVVYLPGASDPAHAAAARAAGVPVQPYQGSFTRPGDEVQLGDDFFLQVQSYSIAAFLALLGPTAVRVADEEDVEAYTADADAALDDGVWSDVLTNPAVQPADAASLGDPAPDDGPRLRLYVDREHTVRVGPLGPPLGSVDTPWARLGSGGPGPEHLPSAAADGVLARPWLARYHAALRALQAARSRGAEDAEVSGFGVRFGDGMPPGREAADATNPLAPVLLRTPRAHLVHVPATRTLFEADRDSALALERAVADPGGTPRGPLDEQARAFVARCAAPAEAVGA